MEVDDTNAQVQETQADPGQDTTQTQADEASQDRQQTGFQARIDELTRERREQERMNRELTATVARLTQQMAEVQGSYAQRETTPAVEIDPEQKKVFDAYFGPMMHEIRAKLDQATQVAHMGRLHQEAPGEDPRVLARAQELLPAVLKAGWAPSDALDFARGELVRKGVLQPSATQGRDDRGRYTGPNMITSNGQPPNTMQGAGPSPLPANFDRLPPDKQIEILEKRGVHNQPIFHGETDY